MDDRNSAEDTSVRHVGRHDPAQWMVETLRKIQERRKRRFRIAGPLAEVRKRREVCREGFYLRSCRMKLKRDSGHLTVRAGCPLSDLEAPAARRQAGSRRRC